MVEEETITDGTVKKLRNLKPFKSGEEWTGNALGRPKGSISVMDSIRHIFESDPVRFQEFINEYLKDTRNRQHIVEMIDGKPKGSETNVNVAIQNNVTIEDRAEFERIEAVMAIVGDISLEELKQQLS